MVGFKRSFLKKGLSDRIKAGFVFHRPVKELGDISSSQARKLCCSDDISNNFCRKTRNFEGNHNFVFLRRKWLNVDCNNLYNLFCSKLFRTNLILNELYPDFPPKKWTVMI